MMSTALPIAWPTGSFGRPDWTLRGEILHHLVGVDRRESLNEASHGEVGTINTKGPLIALTLVTGGQLYAATAEPLLPNPHSFADH